MLQPKGLIAVVDDDDDIRLALSMLLSNQGYRVLEANGPRELAGIMARDKPALVLLDMNFRRDTTSGAEGLEILSQLKGQNIPTVLMTAWGKIELAVKGMQLGAVDFIEKPWDNQKLLQLVDNHIQSSPEQKAASSKPVAKSPEPMQWIAQSPAMKQLELMIQQVADTQASVLILGENGTGKSMLAQRLHQLSGRSEQAFVSVNMGAVPDNLFESELFGHKKGAFTDARENRQGRFELAQHGTLFLDEIGALPASVQPKLLRVLESGEYEPVGASQTSIADVRVISATNAQLEHMVGEGAFRQDLLFRLNTFILHLPPLRERQADLMPLCEQLIDQFSARYNKPKMRISQEVCESLLSYSWPGNVRELSHVVERAVILCRGDIIEASQVILPQSPDDIKQSNTGLRHLDDVELDMIKQALHKYHGHISRAASALGISRNALYRRMEKYHLDKDDFDIE